MDELFEELLQLLEKTTVIIEFDRSKIGYIDAKEGIVRDEEDEYFLYTVKVDGFSELIKYSERIDILIQEFTKEIESHLNDKIYYKDIKAKLEKIKTTVLSIYLSPDISSFSDQSSIFERVIGPTKSYYFDPNIYLKYINGNALDSDWGEFKTIKKFVDKKFHFARRLEAIASSNLELLKEQGGGKKFETLMFREERLLDSPRFINFHKGLIEKGLIDKINLRLFTKCFSGKEVHLKINWLPDNKLALAYFVRELKAKKIIANENQWIALSNSFLFAGETLLPNTFSTISKKKLPNVEIRGFIDELINMISPKRTSESPI